MKQEWQLREEAEAREGQAAFERELAPSRREERFWRQTETLLKKGYLAFIEGAGRSIEFLEHLYGLLLFIDRDEGCGDDTFPFTIVVPRRFMPLREQAARMEVLVDAREYDWPVEKRYTRHGMLRGEMQPVMKSGELCYDKHLECLENRIATPDVPYLLCGVSRDKERRWSDAQNAVEALTKEGKMRFSLTAEEIIALATHYPRFFLSRFGAILWALGSYDTTERGWYKAATIESNNLERGAPLLTSREADCGGMMFPFPFVDNVPFCRARFAAASRDGEIPMALPRSA